MAKKVLVIGGSYFIGKKIVDNLRQDNYEVTVLNRGSVKMSYINQLICDRNNGDKLKDVLSGKSFDYVIDVSGLNKNHAVMLCNAINLSNLKKFIFISSSAVYDIENLPFPFRETDPLRENIYWTDYGRNKIEAENYYEQRFADTDVSLIMLRPPYVYGENNYVQRESFIFEHICNNKPVIIPDSNPKLQFIYATDLANITVELINRDNEKVSIYNVGNTDWVSAGEWVKACANAAGRSVEIIPYDYKADGRTVREFFPFNDYDHVLDVHKIKEIIPSETKFEEGLKAAYLWYLKERKNINFKENVIENEKQILQKLAII